MVQKIIKSAFLLIISLSLLSFTNINEKPEAIFNTGNSISKEDKKVLKDVKDKKLRKEIEDWLGTPYKYGSCSKKGTDCSGLVSEIYKQVYNITLPRSSKDMSQNLEPIKKQKKLEEGDLVFFKISGVKVSHVGIYLTDGYFVHSSTKRGVVISNLSEDYYAKHYFRGGKRPNS